MRTLISTIAVAATLFATSCKDKEAESLAEGKAAAKPAEPKAEPKAKPAEPKAAPAKKSGAAYLTMEQATPLFPAKLGRFTLSKAIKIKPRAEQGVEIKGTYKGADKKSFKLVINDFPPDGNPAWKTVIDGAGKVELKGFTAAFEKKGEKSTWMVLVAKRFRVDFKSRTLDKAMLRALADAFDFNTLAALK